jgi:hypothetical protein
MKKNLEIIEENVMKTASVFTASALFAAYLTLAPLPQAQAGFKAGHTSQGAASGRVTQGKYGTQGCARVGKYGSAASSTCASTVTGPNGGTSTSGRSKGYKAGTGGYSAGGFSTTGANGGTASGTRKGTYNAQTGTGTYTGGKSATVNGQSYGSSTTGTYQKGEGGTATVTTQNNGTVTCTTGTQCAKVPAASTP